MIPSGSDRYGGMGTDFIHGHDATALIVKYNNNRKEERVLTQFIESDSKRLFNLLLRILRRLCIVSR